MRYRLVETPDEAEELHTELGIYAYDRSVPGVLVFQKSLEQGGIKLREKILRPLRCHFYAAHEEMTGEPGSNPVAS